MQNQVIAGLSHCPVRLKPTQYVDFGSFRSGHCLQWWNLLSTLELDSLSMDEESVAILISHSLWQYGPVTRDRNALICSWCSESHQPVLDDHFVDELISRLDRLLTNCGSNWQNEFVLVIITVIVMRIFTLCNSVRKEQVTALALKCRHTGEKWIQLITESISDASSSGLDQVDGLRDKIVLIGVACLLTFSVHRDRIRFLLSSNQDVISFLKAATTVHDNIILSKKQKNASVFVRNLMRYSERILVSIHPTVSEFLQNTWYESLNEFAGIYWSAIRNNVTNGKWKKRNTDVYDGWYDGQYQSTLVSIDCLKGTFLVNKMTVGFLPEKMTSSKLFRRVFGDHVFEVQAAETQGVYITKHAYHGDGKVHYEFSYNASHQQRLTIQERHIPTDARFELIPTDCLQTELPDIFISKYSHWKNKNDQQIEFRPVCFQDSNFLSDKQYLLVVDTGFLTTNNTENTQILIDRASSFFLNLFKRYFIRLDDEPYVYMLRDNASQVTDKKTAQTDTIIHIHLSRLGIAFKYDVRKKMITSREYPDMHVGEEQWFVGTLKGLKSGLLLSPTVITDQQEKHHLCRKLIVPFGEIVASRTTDRDHHIVTVDRTSLSKPFLHQYFVFILNDRLRILQSTDSPTGWLYLALLHATTSHAIPDQYTGMIGMERAFQLLNSAGCHSDQPYDSLSLDILLQIACLSPKASYYPEHLTCMVKIEWNSDGLPYSIQHFGYYLIVKKLLQTSEQWNFMHPVFASQKIQMLFEGKKYNEKLLGKLYWDYRDSYNPTARLSAEMEREIQETSLTKPYQPVWNDCSRSTNYNARRLVYDLYLNGNVELKNSGEFECFPLSQWLMTCEPFRYLISLCLNIKLCSYREVSFQTLHKIETHNSTATQCEMLWLEDKTMPVEIAPDMDFRTLVAAQDAIVNKYTNDLIAENKAYINRKHEQKDDVMLFASFFAEPLRNAVIEWVENYIAITQDQSLIHLLHDRFWVDGCHLSVFEVQFILASCASLRTLYHCDLNYILLLANSVAQSQLVDVFLYVRIEYHFGRRLSSSSKIYTGIQLIPNSRYKALFAVKLSKYDLPIDEDDVHKLLLMLQHASNGSEQLVNMDLDEWISIARKQKWSEMGYILKKYGSIGYYLGVLDVQKFSAEEKKMRSIIDGATILAEKLVALYTQWIVTKEIEMNDKFYHGIKKYFVHANGYPGLTDKEKKYQLITKEIEQARLINWISTGKISENHVNYELFASQADRTVDALSEKITGLHDSPEEATKRRESIQKIAQILKSNEKCENMKWLNKFDDELFKIENKRLRDTQKMAVLCAVESKKHVLEQVNTGEGKSYVIVAIATIRCKTGKRYVDIITSSPVLAQRDAAAMVKLYGALGLNVADNCSEDLEIRKKAYTADIVYGDMARFQRDYLLHTFYKKPLKGDRTQVAVIVDEVDNMLLDNGNNMLYLSHSVPGMDLLDSLLIFIQKEIYTPIYTGDKNNIEQMQKPFDNTTIKNKVLADLFGQFSRDDLRSIARYNYTEVDILAIYEKLIQNDIIDGDGYLKVHRHDQLKLIEDALKNKIGALIPQIQACFSVILSRDRLIELPPYLRSFAKLHLDELIENCKQAMFLEANTGYVVDVDHTGKLTSALESVITIIDSNTGVDLASSQWCGGLHQFLQLKHGCRLSPISLKAVFVSNVAYLKGYEIINGLSGTLGSTEESKTLIELYNADLIKIPTNRRKIFYEHVPIIATVQEEWIQNSYDEICDQVTGTRSVLLICEDIKQLEYVLNGLTTCFGKHTSASDKIKECFTTITVYKREHDEFNFEDTRKLEPHRLIIATNLAGRGTDIKLSQTLINAGGLHVITAFMPKNCRIEEQAFGRAARCGQPGSAQIIAYDEPADNAVQPSIFQLKMFRDNKEVERLQSLKTFYDYHTEIEELCLEKFRNYCDQALSAMYSNATAPTDETIPTPSQLVYFALLDQWALWLDAKARLIKQCASERSQQLKETLINSVDEFLQKHPFGDKSNCFEIAKGWIDAPQSLLTIGIIQMHHMSGYQEAEETFNKILVDGHEFSAEAHYYKACMRMRNFGGTREELKSLTLVKPMAFQENISEAIEHFYKARTLFLNRLQRKQIEASIVAQLVEKAPVHHPKTSGFASQHKSISTYIHLILTNIDYLLGAPCQPNMFMQDGIDEAYSRDIYYALYRQGLISPTVLTGRPVEPWQAEPFRRKYKLHKKQIETIIERMSKDVSSVYFEDYNVLERSLILKYCPLATKSDFWSELEQQKALYNTETYVIIHDKSAMSAEIRQIFDQLTQCQKRTPTETRTLLQYSNKTNATMMYKLKDIENLMGNNQKFKDEVHTLIDKGSLKLDKMAKVLIVPDDMSYFSDFDGVTTDDLKEFFCLNEHGAGWIANLLRNNGILELQTVQMMRLTFSEQLWKKLVRIHLDEPVKEPKKDDPIEFKLLYNNAGILQQIKNERKLLNITEQVITYYMEVPSGVNKSEVSKKFYAYLTEQKILEPYLYNVWRLNSKLDCSSLPRAIADHVDEFLADRFAYSFALEKLCLSLEAATKDPEPTPHQIFLAENPFADLSEDFVNYGLAMPSRLCTSTGAIDEFDYEDFQHLETIKSIIHSNRLKLYDQTDYHMEVTPFSTYILDQGFTIDSDLRVMMNNGLKMVVTRKKEKAGWWLLNKIVAAAAWCWDKIKRAASAVASFCYSIVQFVVHLPGQIFSVISDFVSPYVKQAAQLIQRIVQPLLDTRLGKMTVTAMQFAKEAVLEVGHQALGAAEWVISKGTQAVNYVGKKATEVVNWVGDTQIVKGTIGVAKDFGAWIASTDVWKVAANMAVYVYTTMSNFCTAISESYQYYNQCRTAARRLAIEKQGLVDEHAILVAFHGVSDEENKKANEENATDEVIRANIEAWRVSLLKSLVSTLDKSIHHLSKDKYAVDFVKSTMTNSFAWKHLESEVSSLLNYYGWSVQIWYFKRIQTAFQNNTPFTSISFACSREISSEHQFFLEDGINQILEELEKQTNDDGYESNAANDSTGTINDIFKENIQYADWKDVLTVTCTNLMKKSIDVNFIEPNISIILSYITSLRDANMSPSEAQLSFTQEDKKLKQALAEYKLSNQSKSKTQFLMMELYSIIHKIIKIDDLDQSRIILKTAVKYGYPIPLSAVRIMLGAMHRFLTKSAIYTSGILLEISDDQKRIVIQLQTADGRAKMKMRHIDGAVFLCRNDYSAYTGMLNQTSNEEIDNAFFYEVFIGYLKYLHSKFPKQGETLREGILNEL